jgi:D-threo-aldose 1-dehydrogenase
MNPPEKAPLGKTAVRVTRLGLGGAPLAGLYLDVPDADAAATVKRALELGLNFIDTAPLYGHGKGELRLGQALGGRAPASFVVATKVGRVLVPEDAARVESPTFDQPGAFRPVFDFSRDGVMRSFEDSRKRLGLERINVVHLHDPDDHYEQAIAEAFPALDELRRQGAIDAIGAGMNQAEMLARLARECDFDCFLLAGRYTLIDHTGLQELLPLCLARRIGIIIGGPYNSGILATGAQPGAKFNYVDAPSSLLEKVRRIEVVGARHGVPLKAAALQFPLAHAAVVAVIPGARSAAEVDENFRLMSHPIPRDFWMELRAAGLLPVEAPVPGDAP